MAGNRTVLAVKIKNINETEANMNKPKDILKLNKKNPNK